MNEQKQGAQGKDSIKWIFGTILGIGVLIWVASLSSTGVNTDTNSVSGLQSTNSDSGATQASPTPEAPLPLDPSAAKLAYRQFKTIAAAQVPGGSEIFSENCYAALGKPFDWHQLDRCGAYDALAVHWTEENEAVAGNDDLTYFQSETAATRFLQAATSGGLPADQADIRWAALQSMAAKAHIPTKSQNSGDSSQGAGGLDTHDANPSNGEGDGNTLEPSLNSD
jgi:hypothetical protein